MITSYFEDEIRYLVMQGDHYAFHAPERILFPSDMRDSLATLSYVANDMKRGIIDRNKILGLCEVLETKLLGWVMEVKTSYREIEKKAVGDLPVFSEDLVELSDLLVSNRIHEDKAIEKAKKIDSYIKHLRKSEDVERFCSISKEFPWLKGIILADLLQIRALFADQETSVVKISDELIKITEILDKTSIDLANESHQFDDKVLKMRSDLVGAKERLSSIRAKIIKMPKEQSEA